MNAWLDVFIIAVASSAVLVLTRWWGVRDDLRTARDRADWQFAQTHRIAKGNTE